MTSLLAKTWAIGLLANATATGTAPSVPVPPALAAATGFSSEMLDPYEKQIGKSERDVLIRLSEHVLKGPGQSVVTTLAAALQREAQSSDAFARKFVRDVAKVARIKTIPELLFGLNSQAEVLPPIPRLANGVFTAPTSTTPVENADASLFEHPERACTISLGPALTIDSSPDIDLNAELGAYDIPSEHLDALIAIMTNPQPFARSNHEDVALPGVEDGQELATLAAHLDDTPAGSLTDPLSDASTMGKEQALARRLKDRDLPLPQFLAEVAKLPAFAFTQADATGPAAVLLKSLLNLTQWVAKERQSCVTAGHTARDVRRVSNEDLQLFACVNARGERVGSTYKLVGDGILPLSFRAASYDSASKRGVELAIDQNIGSRGVVTLTALLDGSPLGPQMFWTLAGAPAALTWNAGENDEATSEFVTREWYDNGALKLEAKQRADDPGDAIQMTAWYPNGSKWSELARGTKSLVSAGSSATYREWHESGTLSEEATLRQGKLQGLRKLLHENGQTAAEITYRDGEANGAFAMYYSNGIKGVTGTMSNGLAQGDLEWWHEDGKPLFKGRFDDGEADGAQKLYRPNGHLLTERGFKSGVPEGTWRTFDDAGKILRERSFQRGQPEGTAFIRYADGKPLLELGFKQGQIQGPLTAYYPSGQRATTCQYDQGELASFVRWTQAGAISVEGKVEDPATGSANVRVLRKSGSPMLQCRFAHFEVEECTLLGENGDQVAMPSEKDIFATQTDARSDLTWKPERCGGAMPRWGFDDLIDAQGDRVDVSFEVTDACPDATLASALLCSLRFEANKVSVGTCARASSTVTPEDELAH